MAYVWVAVGVLTTWPGGASGLAWALDCGGRLVSEGQASWEVQARGDVRSSRVRMSAEHVTSVNRVKLLGQTGGGGTS
jgi:hypothetical protein